MNLVDLTKLLPAERAVVISHARTWWPELIDFMAGTQLDPDATARDGRRIAQLFISVEPEMLQQSTQLPLRLVVRR